MKKTSGRRRATTTVRRTLSFDAMVRAAVAKAALVPDLTDFLSLAEQKAMTEEFINGRCDDATKQELRAHVEAYEHSDVDWSDVVWIREEIAYALGVEVGRRLAGGGR